MTKLYEQLQLVMDLEHPWGEANKKLLETVMIINGSPMKLRSFVNESSNEIIAMVGGNKHAISVETLATFLPEPGLYMQANGFPCLVIKFPKRQWLKSYHDSFYKIVGVGGNPIGTKVFEAIHKGPRQDIMMDKKGDIWYWENLIGKKEKDESITCLDLNFSQELIDWRKANACIHPT